MQGRRAARLAQRAQTRDERVARARRGVLRHQQASARHRREGRGDLNFGVIAAAHPLVGLRPILVEHIFAQAVRLEIGGRGGDQTSVRVLDENISGRPARAGADRFRSFQREQKCARNERVVSLAGGFRQGEPGRIGACVPRLRVDKRERRAIRAVKRATDISTRILATGIMATGIMGGASVRAFYHKPKACWIGFLGASLRR